MTDLNDREEPLGDRLKLLELVVAHLADRTSDIEKLSLATDRLSESTVGLDSALREVGKIRERQDDLIQTVQDQADHTSHADAMVPKRWFWVAVICLVLTLGLVAFGTWDRQRIRDEIAQEHRTVCRLVAEQGQDCGGAK